MGSKVLPSGGLFDGQQHMCVLLPEFDHLLESGARQLSVRTEPGVNGAEHNTVFANFTPVDPNFDEATVATAGLFRSNRRSAPAIISPSDTGRGWIINTLTVG